MGQGKAQHCLDGLRADRGDLFPFLSLDEIFLYHPSTADGGDLLIGQIIHQVFGIDATGAHPLCRFQSGANIL